MDFLRHKIINPEEKWRDNTECQKNRNTIIDLLKKEEKIEFIKWVKRFNSDPYAYDKFCNGQYKIHENIAIQIMIFGYIADISEAQRLFKEGIFVKWSPIPFGINQNEWDYPDSVKESIMDRECSMETSSEIDINDFQLGSNINLLEEVDDRSDSEPEDKLEIEEYEVNSLIEKIFHLKI